MVCPQCGFDTDIIDKRVKDHRENVAIRIFNELENIKSAGGIGGTSYIYVGKSFKEIKEKFVKSEDSEVEE